MNKKDYYRNYREKNKERLNNYQKEWRAKNKEKVKIYNERYWNSKEGENE